MFAIYKLDNGLLINTFHLILQHQKYRLGCYLFHSLLSKLDKPPSLTGNYPLSVLVLYNYVCLSLFFSPFPYLFPYLLIHDDSFYFVSNSFSQTASIFIASNMISLSLTHISLAFPFTRCPYLSFSFTLICLLSLSLALSIYT